MKFLSSKKILFYSVVSLASIYVLGKLDLEKSDDFRFLETSMVNILKNVSSHYDDEPPDLGIEKVTLKKVADPTDGFNYYKYFANVVIRNYGGDLKNAQLILKAGEDQKHIFVKNEYEGFSLERDKNYIIDNYEILFDGNYNGGQVTLELSFPENVDYYDGNNKFLVNIFELPPKIEALNLLEILEDGTQKLEFETADSELNLNGIEVYVSDILAVDDVQEKYAELKAGDKIYDFQRIKNSAEILEKARWKYKITQDLKPDFLKFSNDPYTDRETHFVYLRSTDKENGNFAISNILKFSPQKNLNRAAFAKLFVDFAGIDISGDSGSYFDDVSAEAWYAPYVNTLYFLGLINNDNYKYNPNLPISRGEVLKIVLDYFDVDLATAYGEPHFQDIQKDHYLYPYVEALFNTGSGGVFGEYFSPETTATKNYLKFLINEYKENS